ncbi:MAG: AAA-like domain-containing protein [Rivularia sp. (in: cyanobacteria)]
MFNEYRFSGSLPENASTYVTREADTELYESLTVGKFCYVLNSRQSGKSSIRVRTMRRLRDAGVECAAIDLSAGGVQNVTPEQWYVDLIDHLIESFALDVDLGEWWGKNQLHSEVTRFRKFIEEVLLVDVKENIVVFIDEIDSVLSLKFPTDDFFALIRAFHNQRVDNSDYNRLTFCLLGVASPSNLIQDKQRTPFNIGRGIHLKGFQLHEVEPLRKGLEEKFADSQTVMQEILNWTGGQPFLTQKLCQLMVEESEKDNPRSVEQVARARIIENWELQDEPEHLRTIRSRILRNEERAGYLLDLYQQICSHGDVVNNDSAEQSELLLSGLVGKQQEKLGVYNLIYQEVFNLNWVEAELRKLRPYSEAFRAWVASGFVDESRLLRGNALKDAEEWGKNKNLSYQDKQFLAASKEKEIQEEITAREKEAQLERERKDREATEDRNSLLTSANIKAKRQIRKGSTIVLFALFIAAILGVFALKQVNHLVSLENEIKNVQKLSKLAGKLRNENLTGYSDEALKQAGLSFRVNAHNLKQALLMASIAQAYHQLEMPKEAQENIATSLEYLKDKSNYLGSEEEMQIKVFVKIIQGQLIEEKDKLKAIVAYKEAYEIIKNNPENTNPFKYNKILIPRNIESVYRGLFNLLANQNQENFRQQIKESLKEHLLTELEYSLKAKKWQEADEITSRIILFLTNREKEGYLDESGSNNLSCPLLQQIDKKWLENSKGNFGFSIQKKIWIHTKNRLGLKAWTMVDRDYENYFSFSSAVKWDTILHVTIYDLLSDIGDVELKEWRGVLPLSGLPTPWRLRASEKGMSETWHGSGEITRTSSFFSRAATCNL